MITAVQSPAVLDILEEVACANAAQDAPGCVLNNLFVPSDSNKRPLPS